MKTIETGHLALLTLAFTFVSCASSDNILEGSIGFGLDFDRVEIGAKGDQLVIRYQKDVIDPSLGTQGKNTPLELVVPVDLDVGEWVDIAYEAELRRYVFQTGGHNPERDAREFPALDEGFLFLEEVGGPGQIVAGQFWIHFEDNQTLRGSFREVLLSE